VPRAIILIPEAFSDVTNAYSWYEQQKSGLGEEFLACLEAAYSRIAENPLRYPRRFDDVRRILLKRFPYAVYFEHDNNTIWIHYVFHCAQSPEKLLKRLKED